MQIGLSRRSATLGCAVALVAALAITGATWAASQQAILAASDAATGDAFGWAVGVSGDTVIIGSWLDDVGPTLDLGAAYVYVQSGALWPEQAKLTASDADAFDRFGYDVAIEGDTAVISAIDDDGAGADAGAAYIFVRTGTTWAQEAKLTASDAGPDDRFGESVDISGDTVVIGANFDDDDGSLSGSAYVFVRTGTVWTEEAKLIASDGAAGDQFGQNVAIDDDTVIVGAMRDQDFGAQTGSAYVFVRSGTTWTEEAKLLGTDTTTGDWFGSAVDVNGDTAIVGAFRNDDTGGTDQGAAYVFTRSGTIWTQEAKLLASDGYFFDNFGDSVALEGNTAFIGADRNDDSGMDSGSAYVFHRSGTTWTEDDKVIASDGAAGDQLSESIDMSGDIGVAGARLHDIGGLNSAGHAYIFIGLSPCPSDFSSDGMIDGADLAVLLAAWGPCAGCPEDLNADGFVDGADLAILLSAWGPC